jgi:hypothetical protein
MLEQIIEFITPGPLSEKFAFRTRVLTSWISLGLLLGLIMSVVALNSNVAAPNGPLVLVLQCTVCFTIMYFLSGLMGVGLNVMREDDPEYFGWYWWLLPTVGFLVACFWLTMFVLGLIFSLFGISSLTPSISRQPQFNPDQFRRKVREMKVEDIFKEFDQQFKQIEGGNQLKPEEKKVIKKLKSLDRAALRSRLRDALGNDEMEIFLRLILFLIGFEKR